MSYDTLYKILLDFYSTKYPHNPEGILKLHIDRKVKEGLTEYEAIVSLLEQIPDIEERSKALLEEEKKRKHLREVELAREQREQHISQFREKLDRLTVLFSKGEISEESYKNAVKTIEENIRRLRSGEKFPVIKEEKEIEISEVKEVREGTTAKPIALKYVIIGIIVILLIVGAGIGIYYSQLESLKKPQFNVFDVRPSIDGIAVYIQNIGNKDAHEVEISIEMKDYPYHSDWTDASVYGFFPRQLPVLEVGVTEKVVFEASHISPVGIDEFKVTVSCKEGVTQTFYFKK